MKATLVRLKLFPDLPSASGMEVMNNKIYVVGDDSPLLYELDIETWQIQNRYPLFETSNFTTGRIPKPLKPDLECLAGFTVSNKQYLLAFGSGSTPVRNTCYLVQLPDSAGIAPPVEAIPFTNLYQALQADQQVTAGNTLNLEAAATSAEHLYLFQRSVGNGPNVLLVFSLPAFMAYLQKPEGAMPDYSVIPFRLPEIDGFKAGFSGASFFDGKIFITASVENTNDAYQDGEVLGSFVGYIEIDQLPNPVVTATRLMKTSDQPYPEKVESISITGKSGHNQYQALAITDNDNGQSELLELALIIK